MSPPRVSPDNCTSRKADTRDENLSIQLSSTTLAAVFSRFDITGRTRLIRSHSSARFCFELSGNSKYNINLLLYLFITPLADLKNTLI